MYHDLFSPHSEQEATLVNLLRYRAQQQPNQIPYTFLVDGETEKVSFTYETLDQKARSIAALLQSMKAFGERVLLLYPPGLEFIAAFFGGLYAGVTVVPVYPPRGKQRMIRLQAIAKDAQATFALTTSSVITKLGERFKEEPELAALQCIATDNIAENLADDWFFPEITNNSLALLQYTSGTTGNPKGVMVNHDNLLYNSALIYQAFEHTPDSRGVIWLPPYHDMGLIGGVLQPVYGSCSVTLMSPESFLQKPFRWLKAISDYKANTSGGPNFAYDLCVDKITPEQRQQLDLSSWEVAFNGAEPVRTETIEKFSATFADCGFKRSAFYPCYGMAETTLIVSGGLKKEPPVIRFVQDKAFKHNLIVTTKSESEDAKAIVGVGHSSLDQKIAIANPELLTRCLDGQIGEIWVAGQSIAGGYWNKPEQTQQIFNAQLQDTKEEPFLRTGDLGFLHDGELFVTGRLKDMMIIRGQNHYPQDIEFTVQNSHPALRANCGAAFSVEIDGVEQLVITQEIERTYLRQLDVDEVVKAIRQAVSEQHQLQVYAIVLLKTASIPKTSRGMWVITRYADAKAVLRDSRFCVNKMQKNVKNKSNSLEQRDFDTLAQAIDKWLIYLDPPEHTRLRGLISKAFSSTSIKFLRPQIQQITNELISKVRHKGFMDIISDFACPLPCNVIAAILGIPVEDWFKVYHWSDELSKILDPLSSVEGYEQMNRVALEFTNYFKSLIAQRQKSPQQDLLSALITVKEQNSKLSEDEIISICMLLFLTGEETTVNLIGNGMLALLNHPQQMQQIKTQPILIQSAVEEILRYDSPIQITTRVATEDVVLDGVTVRCGEKVLVVLGAANRDPAQFPDPDRFDITRVNNNHLAFADGIHYCLGAALTRIEGEIAINALVQQLPDFQLSQDKVEWRKKVAFRSLKSLPVTFKPTNINWSLD